MDLIERLYDAAASAGLLTLAKVGSDESSIEVFVEFSAPDEHLLDGLAIGRDYRMRYPASRLPMLAVGNEVEIAGQTYRVREVMDLGDGSEQRATLTKI
jgi:hypothetical protein